MRYELIGDNLQMVKLSIEPGEKVRAEAGSMVNMSGNMEMSSKLKGGIFGGIKRVLSSESLFLSEFTPSKTPGFVSFAGNVPGKIFPLELNSGSDFIAQKDAFLCSEENVELDIVLTKKIRAGLFAGDGFILERLYGEGMVFLHCCGDLIEMNLEPGETVRVETGLVVGFESSVDYSINLAGGVKTVLFGGEGLFLTTLTGPGKVILQSMDIAKLAASLIPFMPTTSGQ
ncbi:TIGR00266 family protein [Methanoplanus sp. FWC-SCC4]|uniref:TIGR00266 family protein n=1 Tax=Methanochimaera problematica TaxID=2609417 RepID=A0AA97FCX2_9EURY|nr:TIGR00266 family protein [Methanoplanus sp. FWC-SCC4]WOF16747.1 TIGR00266 family protein [Methanoplanus sp. FWC-SCC4]